MSKRRSVGPKGTSKDGVTRRSLGKVKRQSPHSIVTVDSAGNVVERPRALPFAKRSKKTVKGAKKTAKRRAKNVTRGNAAANKRLAKRRSKK